MHDGLLHVIVRRSFFGSRADGEAKVSTPTSPRVSSCNFQILPPHSTFFSYSHENRARPHHSLFSDTFVLGTAFLLRTMNSTSAQDQARAQESPARAMHLDEAGTEVVRVWGGRESSGGRRIAMRSSGLEESGQLPEEDERSGLETWEDG